MYNTISKMSGDELQILYDNSDSYSEILEKLGLCKTGGSSRITLKKYEHIKNIDKNKFIKNNENRKINQHEKLGKISKQNRISLSEMLIENSSFSSKYFKKRLIEGKIIEYKCSKCNNEGEWFGEKLVLQLDHINGISNDNRIENLRFLCPNCHTQTETYSSKNKNSVKKKKKKEQKREKIIRRKAFLIKERKEILDNIDINHIGWIEEVKEKWGVSHAQVKRWVKKYYPGLVFFQRRSPLCKEEV